MSLQERTLVIKNFDPDKTTADLLKELCMQTGPIRNVVLRPDHAFIEYEDVESVGYSKALLDGISLFGRSIIAEPKLRHERYLKHTRSLNDYIAYDKSELEPKRMQEQQMRQMQDNQMKMLTLPPLYLISKQAPTLAPLQMPQMMSQMPQMQMFNQDNMQQSAPIQNLSLQQPQLYMQAQYMQPMHQQSYLQQNYQAPPDVMQFQCAQTGPFIADPMRPPPEGRGYMPWIHDPIALNRARSFNHVNQNMYAQQQRRLSDKPVNFTNRRR